MKYKVGDRVAFSRDEATISGHAVEAFGIDYINDLIFKNCKFHKGTITAVKTNFLLFKLKNPIYLIDDYYEVKNIKPIITLKAELA